MFSLQPPRAVLTPCIGICELGPDEMCQGCHRTRGEIARWGSMPDAERLYVMTQVLPEREAQREAAAAARRA